MLVDEVEYLIPLISDWLELDANDDWVRHDAETVSCAYPSYFLLTWKPSIPRN